MKLLLVNDQGDSVACLEGVEGYDVQDSSKVLALLDFIETLLAAAKGNKDRRDSDGSSFAPVPTDEQPSGMESNGVNRQQRIFRRGDSIKSGVRVFSARALPITRESEQSEQKDIL